MANIRSANTWYIDSETSSSSDDLVVSGIAVFSVLLTSTGGAATITLQDPATVPANKIVLNAKDGESFFLDVHNMAMTFPNGIRVYELDNGVATVIFKENNR